MNGKKAKLLRKQAKANTTNTREEKKLYKQLKRNYKETR